MASTPKAVPAVGSAVAYVYKEGKSGRAWEGTVLYANADLGIVTVAWDAVSGRPRPHFQTNKLDEVTGIPQLTKAAKQAEAEDKAKAIAEAHAEKAKAKAAAKKPAEPTPTEATDK